MIYTSDKGFGEHVDELVDESQEKVTLVCHSKHNVELLVDLPFEKVVLVVELFLHTLRILQQHTLDEDIDELDVEIGSVVCLAP